MSNIPSCWEIIIHVSCMRLLAGLMMHHDDGDMIRYVHLPFVDGVFVRSMPCGSWWTFVGGDGRLCCSKMNEITRNMSLIVSYGN